MVISKNTTTNNNRDRNFERIRLQEHSVEFTLSYKWQDKSGNGFLFRFLKNLINDSTSNRTLSQISRIF